MNFLMIFLLMKNEIDNTLQGDTYIFDDGFECFIFL